MQSISLGKITLTNENNTSVLTEYDVDYLIPEEQKVGFQTGSASWANSTAARPITKDFKAVVKPPRRRALR